jgi:hypothetical protein
MFDLWTRIFLVYKVSSSAPTKWVRREEIHKHSSLAVCLVIWKLDDTPRVAAELVEHELKDICLYSYEKKRKEVHAEFSIAS